MKNNIVRLLKLICIIVIFSLGFISIVGSTHDDDDSPVTTTTTLPGESVPYTARHPAFAA